MVVLENENEIISSLRSLREVECFPIINRGKLWYDKLTLDQLYELKKWYDEWLNVTETKIIPKRLSWIDDKLGETEEITI